MLGIGRSELGGCRLIRRIGAGAMGEVYLAEQVPLGNRLVAVKVVHAEHDVAPPPGAAEDAGWHFIREAQLLGRLTHPNILPVYHSGIEAGYLFLVMQYAPDGSLADAIKGQGMHKLDLPASLPFVVDIVAQVADALQYTHEHQVIHADVKPSNVLVQVEPNGHWRVLLADFGVARSVDSIALRDEVAGTAAYMAPEQFYGQLSPACDQYALGVMAFQLLAGRLPFAGGLVELVQAHARADPPALRALNPAISAAVEAVIVRALAKRPADRYHSMAAFAEALRAASTGANTTVVAASGPNTVWAGPDVDRRDPATARTAPAAAWTEPPPTSGTYTPTVPLVAAESPARPRVRDVDARRRVAPGLAVLALLLAICVAGIGLRSHIDISRAFPSLGGAGQTPTAAGTDRGTGASPTASPGTLPTAPWSPVPAWPTATPTAPPTPQSSPDPTATATVIPQPTAPAATATAQPTAPATSVPQPTATATGAPQPTATDGPQPTQPAATAAAPQPTQQAQPPKAPDVPSPAGGAP
jgi:serine/threonine protein kinase